MIVDDFYKNNLISLVNYTNGVSLVRNYVLLDESSIDSGINMLYYESSTEVVVNFAGSNYTYANVSMYQLVESINQEADFIENNFSASLVSLNAYSVAVQFLCKTTVDYKSFYIRIKTKDDSTALNISSYVEYNSYEFYATDFGNTVRYQLLTLFPYGDTQLIYASDADSILQYGKKIDTVANLDLISSGSERLALANAKLAQLKDPKARCFVTVPFDYEQPNELDLVEVRLSYQNVSRFKDFKEGGHFKSWTDEGTYRYKQFYIVGINHNKEGDKTSLRLIEKL